MVNLLDATSDALEDLTFVSIHSASSRPNDIDNALQGTFRLRDEYFTLSPPVDWWDEPYRGPNERGFFQNSFVFADPLLANRRFDEVLSPLAAIFVDWLTANPQLDPSHPHRYAWHDHAAAGRIVVMAFTLREGMRRNLLNQSTAEALAAGVLEHAQYLLAEENYAAQNNHGFASDAALMLAARSLTPAPQTIDWREVAERRFVAILNHMIDRDEAVHLEHSPSYHWTIRGALSRFAAADLFDDLDLTDLTNRMGKAGTWLVAPDGTLPPLGDTSLGQRQPLPPTAAPDAQQGMRVFPAAGYAAVRDEGSALFVTAAHHPTAHKHADDGSFCLYEEGLPLVLDSGNPGYEYESAEFAYGTSPAAHATICVDGFDWAKECPPYGSGILASAEWNGFYALLTRNPVAVRGGGAARRVLVYKPSCFLLVLDDVEAGPPQELVRTLPLAPDLQATCVPPGEVEITRKNVTIAKVLQLPMSDDPIDDVEVVRGQRAPRMRGFTFPSPERAEPNCNVTFSGPAGHPRGFALLMSDAVKTDSVDVTWRETEQSLDIEIGRLTSSPLVLRVGENTIAFASSS